MSIIKNKNGLLIYQQKATGYMEKIKSAQYSGWEELHEDLYAFILSKYILIGDVTDIYDLTELAELSVAKTIQMTKINAFKADSAHSCEGTTSAMNKKVLLLMAIQRELGIQFSPSRTADLTDTRMIAKEVYQLLAAKEEQAERLSQWGSLTLR